MAKELAKKEKNTNNSGARYIKRYWQLYVLLLLPMVYLIVFKYVPMYLTRRTRMLTTTTRSPL